MGKLRRLTREQRLHVASMMPQAVVTEAEQQAPVPDQARIGGRPLSHWQLFACYGIDPAAVPELLRRAEVERARQEKTDGPEDEEDPWSEQEVELSAG